MSLHGVGSVFRMPVLILRVEFLIQKSHTVAGLKLFAELAGEVLGQFIVDPRGVFPDVVVEATCQIPSHFYAEVR